MRNLLIINGHEKHQFSEGKLNRTIFNKITEELGDRFNIKTTIVDEGYNVSEELEKFKWAEVVIFQHPIYWFSFPAKFKHYIDQVYEYGVFFEGSEKYGRGWLFKEKEYMFSLTWNAPEYTFNDKDEFMEGKTLDEAIFHLHKTNQYVGMRPLKTFSCFDVVQNPDVENNLKRLELHLKEVFKY